MPARPPQPPILAEDKWRAIRDTYEKRFKKKERVSYKSIAKEVGVSPHTVKRAWLIGWPDAGRDPLCKIMERDYRSGSGGEVPTEESRVGTRIDARAPESVHIQKRAESNPDWMAMQSDQWSEKITDAAQRIAWGVTVQAAQLLDSAMPIAAQLSHMLKTTHFDTPERALRVLNAVHTFSDKAATLNDNVAKLTRTLGGGPDAVVDLRVGEVSPAEAEAAVEDLRGLMSILSDRSGATRDALSRYGYGEIIEPDKLPE